jgi:hypothetical protein
VTSVKARPPSWTWSLEFLCLALDITGLGVFNYDFGSGDDGVSVIKAVYRCLREAVRSPPLP